MRAIFMCIVAITYHARNMYLQSQPGRRTHAAKIGPKVMNGLKKRDVLPLSKLTKGRIDYAEQAIDVVFQGSEEVRS